MSDGAGGVVEVEYEMPIWYESIGQEECQMHKGFKRAYSIINKWVKNYPFFPAPVIINIASKKMPDDVYKVEKIVKKIMNSRTVEGKSLIWTYVLLAPESEGLYFFPERKEIVHDAVIKLFGRFSSFIPKEHISRKGTGGWDLKIPEEAKALIVGGDMSILTDHALIMLSLS